MHGSVRCQATGCKNSASVNPTLLLWPKGYSKQGRQPAECAIGAPTCAEFASKMTVENFTILEASREPIRDVMLMLRRMEPDFDTAELRWDALGAFPGEMPAAIGRA